MNDTITPVNYNPYANTTAFTPNHVYPPAHVFTIAMKWGDVTVQLSGPSDSMAEIIKFANSEIRKSVRYLAKMIEKAESKNETPKEEEKKDDKPVGYH